ncbi:hypothetical protein BKI52_34940 [marine bacterium AO1-C]|nr:hypothetical protein BKI52_34940 [marine bacterium AO1-C]
MRLFFLINVSCLLLYVNAQAQSPPSVQIPPTDSIKTWMKQFNVSALGIGTIEQGKLKRVMVLGELKAGVAAPYNTIFDVASLTKSVTTQLTLRLVSEGKWSLDEPLYKYWVDPDVKNDPRHKQLTTRHILSHQSGFVNWRWMHKTKKLTFDFAPGTKVGYSGEGFHYLMRALEKKFKKSFQTLCDQYIFQPYKMADSHLTWRKGVDENRFAIGHNQAGKPYKLEKNQKASAADDLLTTIEDFGRFGVNVLAQKGVSQDAFREMVRPQGKVKPGVAFGLGWIVFDNLPNGEYALFNAGGDKGVAAVIVLLPKSKRGLIIMANSEQRAIVMKMIVKSLDVGRTIMSRF